MPSDVAPIARLVLVSLQDASCCGNRTFGQDEGGLALVSGLLKPFAIQEGMNIRSEVSPSCCIKCETLVVSDETEGRSASSCLSGPRTSTSIWRYDKKAPPLLFDVPERMAGMKR